MPARALCTIDLEAVAHNVGVIRRLVGPEVRICGVVKANAYGHGAVAVARQLERSGANALAVTNLGEALELSDAGISLPLLVLSGIHPEDAPEAARRGIAPVVWDQDNLRALAAAPLRRPALQPTRDIDWLLMPRGVKEQLPVGRVVINTFRIEPDA